MNKSIMIAAGFGKEVDLVEHKRCPTCGNNIGGVHPHNPKENRYPLDIAGAHGYGPFRDALSYKEYGISGMCQKCQDRVFTPKEDPCENCDKIHTDCKLKDDCPV